MSDAERWKKSFEELVQDSRLGLGPLPEAERFEAYFAGELSPESAEEVQRFLVAYPVLVRLFGSPPEDSEMPAPGHPDFISEAQVSDRWQALQASLGIEEKKPPEPLDKIRLFPSLRGSTSAWLPRATAAAALITALVLAGLTYRSTEAYRDAEDRATVAGIALAEAERNIEALRQSLLAPLPGAPKTRYGLSADGGRSGGEAPIVLPRPIEPIQVNLGLAASRGHERYRVELYRLIAGNRPELLSRQEDLRSTAEGTIALILRPELGSVEPLLFVVQGLDESGESVATDRFTVRWSDSNRS